MMRLRKRLVRLHLSDDKPSFEGVLVGRWGGHYHLKLAKLLETPERTLPLDGHIEVPAGRVLFVQRLA